jgi:hypothetical protein
VANPTVILSLSKDDLADREQWRSAFDARAGAGVNRAYDSGAMGANLVHHFHRLDYRHDLPFGHSIAFRHGELDYEPVHRRSHVVAV